MAKKPARIDRRIDVILLESNKHLGEKYEQVKVKPIFAKNVLLPQGKAVIATKDAIYSYKKKMEKAAEAKEKKVVDLSSLFDKIKNDDGLVFSMKVNEKGALYEKIDPAHIVARIKEVYNIDVQEHFFKMKKKISAVGNYLVAFKYGSIDRDVAICVKEEIIEKESKDKKNVK